MMRRVVLHLMMISALVFSDIAPEFPEPYQYFEHNLHHFDDIGYVFGRNTTINPSRIGASIAHQNREWEYNWFLVGIVYPGNHFGTFALGYSNYGSTSIPITQIDQIGAMITEYGADVFESIVVTYEPKLSLINAQFIGGYKHRRLLDQTGQSFTLDINISSPHVLNNQLGIRTRNLISSDYRWKNNSEKLAQFLSVYYSHPISSFLILIEQNLCINYSDLNMQMAQVSFLLDSSLSIFSSYRRDTYHSQISFGSNIQLSEVFNLSYTSKNETNQNFDLSIHSLNIGVKF